MLLPRVFLGDVYPVVCVASRHAPLSVCSRLEALEKQQVGPAHFMFTGWLSLSACKRPVPIWLISVAYRGRAAVSRRCWTLREGLIGRCLGDPSILLGRDGAKGCSGTNSPLDFSSSSSSSSTVEPPWLVRRSPHSRSAVSMHGQCMRGRRTERTSISGSISSNLAVNSFKTRNVADPRRSIATFFCSTWVTFTRRRDAFQASERPNIQTRSSDRPKD